MCKKTMSLASILLFIIITSGLGESMHFESEGSFIKYLLDSKIAESEERLVVDTLFSFSSSIKIVIPKDIEVSMIENTWPVFIFWKGTQGITIFKIMQTPPTSRVAWGGVEIVGMKKIFDKYNGGDVYALEVRDSLVEVTDELDGDVSCKSKDDLYVMLFMKNHITIENLTIEPIELKSTCGCTERQPEIQVKCVNDTLNVYGNPVSEAQHQWIGKYQIESGRLIRAENVAKFVEHLKVVYKKSLNYYRQKDIQRAIAVLAPLVNHDPVGGLNGATVSIYNDYGYFLAEKTRYEDALKVLTRVAAEFSGRTVVHLNLGDVYYGMGEIEKAQGEYRIYMEMMAGENKEGKVPQRVKERVR